MDTKTLRQELIDLIGERERDLGADEVHIMYTIGRLNSILSQFESSQKHPSVPAEYLQEDTVWRDGWSNN